MHCIRERFAIETGVAERANASAVSLTLVVFVFGARRENRPRRCAREILVQRRWQESVAEWVVSASDIPNNEPFNFSCNVVEQNRAPVVLARQEELLQLRQAQRQTLAAFVHQTGARRPKHHRFREVALHERVQIRAACGAHMAMLEFLEQALLELVVLFERARRLGPLGAGSAMRESQRVVNIGLLLGSQVERDLLQQLD